MKLIGLYREQDSCYLVMELCIGGELFDRIVQKQHYSEKEARDVIKIILSAVSYCHARGIVHRDLKPENLLMTSKSDDTSLKVADFGFAARVSPEMLLKNQCGTPGYVAPEILCNQAYAAPVDMWSLGVICYILLGGYPPFPSSANQKAIQKIKKGDIMFHPQFWGHVSEPAKMFIKAMLTIEPKKRITADQALDHPWMTIEDSVTSKPSFDLMQFRLFNTRRKFRSCISSIVIANRLHGIVMRRNISEYYTLESFLGKGSFAVVKSATCLKTRGSVAVKCYPRKLLCKKELKALDDEIRILLTIDHPNILKLIDTFEDKNFYYIVVEKSSGGELFDRIVKKVQYSESDAQIVIHTVVEAVTYCHERNIVHRDLKPENLLLQSKDSDTALKIADFGFATVCCKNKLLRDQCGTPAYVAPEILKCFPYDQSVDMWSIGVISFVLLAGYPPFSDRDRQKLFSKIKHGVYEFHPTYWSNISVEAKDLIRRMLQVNPKHRISAKQALQHPYLRKNFKSLNKDINMNFAQLKLFNAMRKIRSSVDSIRYVQKVRL